MKNKRGLSGVITAVILIAMAMAAVLIVWVVVRNMVTDKLEGAESCVGNYGKITLNNRYTCYNSSSSELQFSISIGDVTVDKVLVSISGDATTKSYTITSNDTTISGLRSYDGSSTVKLPGKNSGLTYISSGHTTEPDVIKIAPVISGKQCSTSDSLSDIDDCQDLIS